VRVDAGGDVSAVDVTGLLTSTASHKEQTEASSGADELVIDPTEDDVEVAPPNGRVVIDLTEADVEVAPPNGRVVIDLTEADVEVAPPNGRVLQAPSGLLAASRAELAAKRILDVVGSTTLLVCLLPVMILIALGVVFTSRGPVFFVQERVGRDGRPFRFYKFRSMVDGAQEAKAALTALNEVTGPVFKIKDDPRVTPLGRWLRRLSLDELPQFWNVLCGSMSLVGPRPPIPEEVALYTEWEKQRLLVKPGLTCIWQVSGRSDVEFANWVAMDIDYIVNWTIWSDIRLLWATIPAVVAGNGAY
jgi:lipopolysaccharide/colanic/teichoic acid biosynthesis glycosyltransferase